MNIDKNDSWILIKPESYLAIPASKFFAVCGEAVNVKHDWTAKGENYSVSSQPMALMMMTDEQMKTMQVRSRLTQASEQGQSDAG